jgi:hypothetical protein
MKKILVISNTSFSIEKFRAHYLNKLSTKYNIKIITPSERPFNLSYKIDFKKLNNLKYLNVIFKIKKEIDFLNLIKL